MRGLGIAMLLGGLLAPAPAAQARDVRPTAGMVALQLSAAAAGRLETGDVRVTGLRSRVVGGTWSFDPLRAGGGGQLQLAGTLRLTRGPLKVRIDALRLAVAQQAGTARGQAGRVSGVIGGVRYPLGALLVRRYTSAPGRFDGLDVELSPAAVGALNGALAVRAFRSGDRLGTFTARSVSQIVRFRGGRADLSLSDATLRAFRDAGAAAVPLPGSTGSAAPTDPLTLPIGRRSLDLVSYAGGIRLAGGLRLIAPAGRTFRSAPTLDLDRALLVARPDGYVLRSGTLDVFRVTQTGRSRLDLFSTRYRHGPLAVRFTPAAAALVAPALGLTAAQLTGLDAGRLDIDGVLRRPVAAPPQGSAATP